jgi:hypothetical protein
LQMPDRLFQLESLVCGLRRFGWVGSYGWNSLDSNFFKRTVF